MATITVAESKRHHENSVCVAKAPTRRAPIERVDLPRKRER